MADWPRRIGPTALGVAAILLVWTIAAKALSSAGVVPTPWAVAEQLWLDRKILPGNIWTTMREALLGYFWGNLAAILLAVLFAEFAVVERVLLKLAIASYCAPLVAIAPILVVVLSGDGPKVALAALAVFFTTLVATVLGLRSMDAVSIDLVRSAGGGAWKLFRLVRLPGALPSLFAGLRVAAPSALLGAVIGEYLGASEGLGVALIQAQSSFEVPRTWGVALVLSGLAALFYATVSLVARLAIPWQSREAMVGIGSATGSDDDSFTSGAMSAIALFVASILAVILAWYALVWLFDLDNFFAKTPRDVWTYLVTAPDAAAHRAQIYGAMGVTFVDAGTGYVVGTLAAVGAAIAMAMLPGLEQAVMPTAIVLRSIPIVAMAPLIALVFGRGLLGVTVVVGLVTFFPTLVLVIAGLRSAPAQACDVILSFGGSRLAAMRKVQLPYALPALFAAARIAAPAAIGGATLAEWLATGSGAGTLLVLSYAASKFATLWAASVVIVSVSVAFYAGLGLIQTRVAAHYGTA
jgi:ABC-type nitrate/sulfonate/bicarbonate transport system permease component